ncbi:unnamed protein product [Caenorhabditis nigoni]
MVSTPTNQRTNEMTRKLEEKHWIMNCKLARIGRSGQQRGMADWFVIIPTMFMKTEASFNLLCCHHRPNC